MNTCETCGDENPNRGCRCNSTSEEPCAWCDWWFGHECPEIEKCAECGCTSDECGCE